MNLFIIRHATAVPQSDTLIDAARPLTEDGQRRFKRAASGIERLEMNFDHLYHSPWLRAVQTASLLERLVEAESHVTELLAMAPATPLLETLKGERVAVVGHEPWLSQLAAWLVFGDQDHASAFVLKKGSLVWLEGTLAPGKMKLNALLTPKALRAAGRG